MKTRTLAQLIADVRRRADVDYDTDRHTDAAITAELNRGIEELQGRLVQTGTNLYRSVTTSSVAPSDAVSGQSYAAITPPATAWRIDGVDVLDGNIWSPLEHVDHKQRLTVSNSSSERGEPQAWSLLTAASTGTLAIYPIPDTTYTLLVTFQVQPTDLAADSDTFSYLPGFLDWVEWYAVNEIAHRDGLPDLQQTAERGMAVAWDMAVRSGANYQVRDGRRKPTRQRRAYQASRSRYERF